MTIADNPVSARAAELDASDPLAEHAQKFVREGDVVAYLDGNSLGRPLRASVDRLSVFARDAWGGRLIRGWDEEWYELPLTVGDELAAATLGAAPGQTFIGDSTTVILYKLIRAAVDARPDRRVIVTDTENFPTDRYIIEGIAAERGLTVRWIEPDQDAGVTPEQVAAAVRDDTAVLVLSHVAYRSGFVADARAITQLVHDAGALVMWDLCHSVGSVELDLDAWGADLAVGCTYKYLNGGPGSPAFGYVRADLQDSLRQPIQGWMGSHAPFEMGPGYQPHPGIRAFLSGTPAVVGMLPMRDMLALIAEVGMGAVRAKSLRLTEFAIELIDELLVPRGAVLSSPRAPEVRGSHVTVDHESFADVNARLWKRGIIPDFRRPHGLRLGLSPLSTMFAEVELGVRAIAEELG